MQGQPKHIVDAAVCKAQVYALHLMEDRSSSFGIMIANDRSSRSGSLYISAGVVLSWLPLSGTKPLRHDKAREHGEEKTFFGFSVL